MLTLKWFFQASPHIPQTADHKQLTNIPSPFIYEYRIKVKLLLSKSKESLSALGKFPYGSKNGIGTECTKGRIPEPFAMPIQCGVYHFRQKSIKILHDWKYATERGEFLRFYVYFCHVCQEGLDFFATLN